MRPTARTLGLQGLSHVFGLIGAIALIACGGGSSGVDDEPAAVEEASEAAPAATIAPCDPSVTWSLPSREARSPAAVPLSDEIREAREKLVAVLQEHARDPENPWAVGHGILALGPDLELTDGEPAVDVLFSRYATNEGVGVGFPVSRGDIRIEPHQDLMLKVLTEVGVSPDREVTVQGEPRRVSDLYRQSLCEAWVDGQDSSFGSWNDSPWALQGLSAWAPAGLTWQTQGHAMSMDGLTGAVVEQLRRETAFMRQAMAQGRRVEKQRQGIFAYTCGGAHLLQGAAHAVARGFGGEAHRRAILDEVGVLFWRLDLELSLVDRAVADHPEYGLQLFGQRLKFLGHFLESGHKLAASGLYEPTEAQTAALDRALAELVITVAMLERAGVWAQLDQVRQNNEQLYLDYVGDAAHAVRGIDLATGAGFVRL